MNYTEFKEKIKELIEQDTIWANEEHYENWDEMTFVKDILISQDIEHDGDSADWVYIVNLDDCVAKLILDYSLDRKGRAGDLNDAYIYKVEGKEITTTIYENITEREELID